MNLGGGAVFGRLLGFGLATHASYRTYVLYTESDNVSGGRFVGRYLKSYTPQYQQQEHHQRTRGSTNPLLTIVEQAQRSLVGLLCFLGNPQCNVCGAYVPDVEYGVYRPKRALITEPDPDQQIAYSLSLPIGDDQSMAYCLSHVESHASCVSCDRLCCDRWTEGLHRTIGGSPHLGCCVQCDRTFPPLRTDDEAFRLAYRVALDFGSVAESRDLHLLHLIDPNGPVRVKIGLGDTEKMRELGRTLGSHGVDDGEEIEGPPQLAKTRQPPPLGLTVALGRPYSSGQFGNRTREKLQEFLDRLSSRKGGDQLIQQSGSTDPTEDRHLSYNQPGTTIAIYVLEGLPSNVAAMTLAHELGHAAFRALVGVDSGGHRYQSVPLDVEEGFCELLVCLWLRRLVMTSMHAKMQQLDRTSQTDTTERPFLGPADWANRRLALLLHRAEISASVSASGIGIFHGNRSSAGNQEQSVEGSDALIYSRGLAKMLSVSRQSGVTMGQLLLAINKERL
eukprot:Clim_evm59s236 gene=Clim_evmTU59s236